MLRGYPLRWSWRSETLDCKDLLAKCNILHLFASTDPPFSGLDPPLFSNPALRIVAGLVLLAIRIRLYQCFTAKLASDYRMRYLENSVPLSWIPRSWLWCGIRFKLGCLIYPNLHRLKEKLLFRFPLALNVIFNHLGSNQSILLLALDE